MFFIHLYHIWCDSICLSIINTHCMGITFLRWMTFHYYTDLRFTFINHMFFIQWMNMIQRSGESRNQVKLSEVILDGFSNFHLILPITFIHHFLLFLSINLDFMLITNLHFFLKRYSPIINSTIFFHYGVRHISFMEVHPIQMVSNLSPN